MTSGCGETYRILVIHRFFTFGEKAVDFSFYRYGIPDPDLHRAFDMKLSLRMSSIQYTHTQRFLSELIAFGQHFIQLQEVLGRMRTASVGGEVRNNISKFEVKIDKV